MSDPTNAQFNDLEQRHEAAQRSRRASTHSWRSASQTGEKHAAVPSPVKPKPPQPSGGLLYNGFVLTVIAAIAAIIGATAPEAQGAFLVALPLGLIGSFMIAVALHRAMNSIDYLARERFRDQNG